MSAATTNTMSTTTTTAPNDMKGDQTQEKVINYHNLFFEKKSENKSDISLAGKGHALIHDQVAEAVNKKPAKTSGFNVVSEDRGAWMSVMQGDFVKFSSLEDNNIIYYADGKAPYLVKVYRKIGDEIKHIFSISGNLMIQRDTEYSIYNIMKDMYFDMKILSDVYQIDMMLISKTSIGLHVFRL